jgi:hypothetical protein
VFALSSSLFCAPQPRQTACHDACSSQTIFLATAPKIAATLRNGKHSSAAELSNQELKVPGLRIRAQSWSNDVARLELGTRNQQLRKILFEQT